MVYLEAQVDVSAALKRERTIKKMKRRQKDKLIEESTGAIPEFRKKSKN